MISLSNILTEQVGRSNDNIRSFIQGLVDNNEFVAYTIKKDRQVVESENELEKVVRIIKGISLTPVNVLDKYNDAFILENADTKYVLKFIHYGGVIDDLQSDYNITIIDRLSESPDLQRFRLPTALASSPVEVPSEFITAEMSVSFTTDYEYGKAVVVSGQNFTIRGETDPLFERVHEFIKG